MSIQNSQQISDIKTMLVKGMNGEGIESIEKTATEGFIDTYTITYTDGTKTTFDVTNGNWGIWTSAVTAAVSATSVTINNDAIGTTSILEVYSQNASGTVITVNDIDVTPGTAVLSFPALAEATDFILHIVNGTASGGGGGGGGTTDYLDLSNKPQINGNTLTGNKLSGELGIPNIFRGTIAEWNQLTTAEKKAYDHASIPDSIDGGVTFPADKVTLSGGGNVEDALNTQRVVTVASVTANGVKTYRQLLNEIYTNWTGTGNDNVILSLGGEMHQQYFGVTYYGGLMTAGGGLLLSFIRLDSANSQYKTYVLTASSSPLEDKSLLVPAQGTVIKLIKFL